MHQYQLFGPFLCYNLYEYVNFQQFQNKITLGVRKITKYLGVF